MAEALEPFGVGSLPGAHPFLLPLALVALACALDRLVGDPRWCPHPVVVMGWAIGRLRRPAEAWAGDRPWALRLAGGLITVALLGASGLAGWGLERLALYSWRGLAGGASRWLGAGLLVVGLASSLAGRSLEQAVTAVLEALEPAARPAAAPDLGEARRRLAWIVGRDSGALDAAGILRALAETASENGVDGLFAPLFWMLVGAGLWAAGGWGLPGPLALAWGFKAASTLDSMLGYRRGRLTWLGTAGARLDDLLVWLPCRLTALSLPLAVGRPWLGPALLHAACRDGRADPSPNAGVSQAAYAHLVGVQLGGVNHYGGIQRIKPLLAAGQPQPDREAVQRMLALNRRLVLLWLLGTWLLLGTAAFITKALS
ncbi:CobD/CbiB family cobalamin biosynthesis protein [Cyanobium sp. CH-040]|uniref:CobD/CbiB family cobalamin biosynthesis protein n=1 Tax=Cyanobium sp. CH-040 TaxID=2823708 RepID=UPI0020CF8956|nr:CobD/CbiB family cobalamin biosynthesis protein [Cyanobium sp. CH-040]MCP9926407.1 cobalamin biosynthesis protein [Cyanobium sp. CH-040]